MLQKFGVRLRRRLNFHRDVELRVRALEEAIACLIANRRYETGDGMGFNCQRVRKQILGEIARVFPIETVVETGTWIGDTTGYLASTLRCPVYSCELHRIPHLIAKMRLGAIENVTLVLGDSRKFLRDLAELLPSARKCFFYLDAHWHADLPLLDELRLIAKTWCDSVIMIDDFRVPGDAGYRYDDYGRGKSLSMQDFGAQFERLALKPYFPSVSSADETGAGSGCVVLAPRGPIAEALRQIRLLREL